MENLQVKEKGGEENQPSKRIIKTQQQTEGGEDRISWLPDCLIIDILSRLPETKQAIRTGTLSKRWQHVWPSVSCLSFGEPLFYGDEQLPDFYVSVDKIVTQCQSTTNLNEFQVCITYDNRFKSHVESWIHFATSRKVRKLDIFLMHTDDNYQNEKEQFVLEDDSFFINPHFTHLSINHCLFKPTGPSISWNNLTNLTISYGRLDNDLIANILSGSPLLDTLKLDCCYGYTRLDITSKSVNNLVINGYEPCFSSLEIIVAEFNVPYISSLTIKGELWLRKILLRDVSSLVKAELDFKLRCWKETSQEKKMLNRLLLNLRHVKELKLGHSSSKVLAYLEVKGILHPSDLKGVDVSLCSYSEYLSEALNCCDNDSFDGDSYSSDGDSSDGNASDSDSVDTNATNSDSVDTNASDSDSVESGDSEEPAIDEVN